MMNGKKQLAARNHFLDSMTYRRSLVFFFLTIAVMSENAAGAR